MRLTFGCQGGHIDDDGGDGGDLLMILVMVVMVILVMINFAQVRPREADHVQGHELSHNGQFRQFTFTRFC